MYWRLKYIYIYIFINKIITTFKQWFERCALQEKTASFRSKLATVKLSVSVGFPLLILFNLIKHFETLDGFTKLHASIVVDKHVSLSVWNYHRKKTGITSILRDFRFNLNTLAKVDILPNHTIGYDRSRDMVTFCHHVPEVQSKANQKVLTRMVQSILK